MKLQLVITLIIIGVAIGLQAQEVHALKEVQVVDSVASRLSASVYMKFDELDQPALHNDQNLSQFLSYRTAVNFKDYGPGMLATPTFRGGDANHTQVLWNGLQINSPMLGTMDFSMLPVKQFSSIGVMTANSSNLYTSGGLGGAVNLIQNPDFQNQTARANYNTGSFGGLGAMVSFNMPFKIGKIPMVVGSSNEQFSTANNFPFIDVSSKPYEKRTWQNAAFNRQNNSAFIGAMPNEKWMLHAIYWRNNTERKLPAPINLKSSVAEQYDEAHRALFSVQWQVNDRLKLSYKSMFEDNANRYQDSAINVNNNNHYLSSQNQLEANMHFSRKLELSSRLSSTMIRAQSENYSETLDAARLSGMILVKYRLFQNKVEAEAGYRYEQFMSNHGVTPFGGITVEPISSWPFKFFASASENVRFPTLNELYWQPGGNDNLKVEQGRTIESGIRIKESRHSYSITAFRGVFNNRIRWLPVGTVFAPTNVSYSETTGLEWLGNSDFQFGFGEVSLSTNVAYINALGGKNDETLLHLSFVPDLSGNASLSFSKGNFRCRYGLSYIGSRYITNDQSAYLPTYWLQFAVVQYAIDVGSNLRWLIGMSVDNLADWQYQNMPWRPMPGRSICVQIDLTWKS